MINKKEKTILTIIRLFLGLVFLSAALFRIFNYDAAVEEVTILHLPTWFVIPIIMLEIGVAICFLWNRYVDVAAIAAFMFLLIAVIIALIIDGSVIVSNLSELFVFSPNPTDIFLHLTFMLLLGLLYVAIKNNSKQQK